MQTLKPKSQIRAALRSATAAVHERLHHHDGFAAVAAGAVTRPDYQRLLERLWGFHRPFEDAVEAVCAADNLAIDTESHGRSHLLAADLATLGLTPRQITVLPVCASIAPLAGPRELMGALYVIEGSTLGGIQLARALAPLMGSAPEGRRFFLGHGENHSAMWRGFLGQLEASAAEAGAEAEIVRGAQATFAAFEGWMAGWRG